MDHLQKILLHKHVYGSLKCSWVVDESSDTPNSSENRSDAS